MTNQDAAMNAISRDIGLDLSEISQRQRFLEITEVDISYPEKIVACMPAGLMVLDDQCNAQSMNLMMRELFGVEPDTSVMGKPLDAILPSPVLSEAVAEVLTTGQDQRNLVICTQGVGGMRHFAFTIFSTLWNEAHILLLMAQEITVQRQLHQEQRLFRLALDGSNDAVYLIDHTHRRFVDINARASQMTGYSRDELLRIGAHDIHADIGGTELAKLYGEIVQENDKAAVFETMHRRKDGSLLPVEVKLKAYGSDGRQMLIAVVRDITERKRIEGELQRLTNHDVLTGLPNRSLLQDRLTQAIAYANCSDKLLAAMLIDLDRFKNINDSLGHSLGDKVLVEVGRRLSAGARPSDTVARLGGDEFVILLVDVARPEDIANAARKVLDDLSRQLDLDNHEFFPSASIGISLYPRDGHDSQTLLKNADTAMYRAKSAGRNTYQFYTQEMNGRALERLTLESRLRHALERNEFILNYQPQVDIVTGAIVGTEALLRWAPAGAKMISPADFIPLAEECGLIVPIGEWVLRVACVQSKIWQDAGLPFMKMAVNLSARQFKQPGIVEMIAGILQETGCPAQFLELEITESVIMEDPDEATRILRRLSEMGIQLSIDDFGTGYSSLSYLKRFPIHALKIDQSFVRDISTDADDAAIACAITVLAHSMKLKVIAEGVETIEQLNFLKLQRCDQMQGYYFSRPMAADQIEKLVRHESGHNGWRCNQNQT